MGLFEDANENAILASGRNAEWLVQTTTTGRPTSTGSGNDMKDTIVALLKLSLREDVAFRTGRVTAPVFDGGDTYTITINGTDHAEATPSDLDALVTDWATAINAGGEAAEVTALAVNDLDVADPGSNTKVKITGDNDLDWTIQVSRSGGGTGTILATMDASSCVARVFGRDGPQTVNAPPRPDVWDDIRWPKTAKIDLPVGNRGYMERFNVSSIARMYAQISDVFGAGDGVTGSGATITYLTSVFWGPSTFTSA